MVTGKPSGEAGLPRETRVAREMQGKRHLLALGRAGWPTAVTGAGSRGGTSSVTCARGICLVRGTDVLEGWTLLPTLQEEMRSQTGAVVKGAENTEVCEGQR